MQKINELKKAMIEYFCGDAKRIQHLIKVHSFSKLIGEGENLDEHTMFILESSALVHDIGIKISEEKYGDSNGKHQELEGPAEAEKVLKKLNYANEDISRICYLVSHHHTYDNIDAVDLQILIEADFLVNLFEDNATYTAINTAYSQIFKTDTGKYLCKVMYNLES
ncbi:MAG: HD domain-containing protein [Eubacteriales bacterium]|nr:HD domain-containing protein [Eubacteriales bacterium]